MKEIGNIIHRAKSGRVIVKLDNDAREGNLLYDSQGREVLRVIEVIGPVSDPYASTIPLKNYTSKSIGIKVFVGQDRQYSRKQYKRR